jgi:hypothetical protein
MQKWQKWSWFTGVSLCLMALLGCGWIFLVTPAAHAATDLLTCTGDESIAYSPGITNTPQTVAGQASDTVGPCVAPGEAGLSGGIAAFTVTILNATCTSITHPTYTVIYYWNNATQSVILFSNTTTTKLATGETQVVSIGSVLSGVGAGESAERTLTNLNVNLLDCFTPNGLQSNAGPFTLAIL